MGRMVANKGNGDCISTAAPMAGAPMPIDIVLVPAGPTVAPTPCVNTAKLADAVMTIDEVKVNGKPVVVKRSQIPQSSGAPSNAIKGLISPPPANNRCNFITSSATVFAGGYPLERHRDVTIQNAGNCPGGVSLKEAFSLHGSGLSVSETEPQRESILNNLDDLYERPRGRKLLDEIKNNHKATGNTITIQSTSGGNGVDSGFDWTKARTPGVGDSSTVNFNPTGMIPVDTRPPAIGLGHELIHSYHVARGTFAPSTYATRANGTLSKTCEFEQQAIGLEGYSNDRLTDNRLREERGLQLRHSHVVPDQTDFSYSPAPGSTAPQVFATGAEGEHFVYVGK
jgi:hypothetical protein